MRKSILISTTLVASLVLIGAGSDSERKAAKVPAASPAPATAATQVPPQVRTEAMSPVPAVSAQIKPIDVESEATGAPASAAAFQINWSSINSGGAISASSANYKMGLSVGQSVAGAGASANYKAGIGFWYGAGAGGSQACAIALTGDVNLTGTLTSADIIYLVNFVFKGGPTPNPCEAAGDVGCNGTVTSADIIYMVNHVFKGGPAPCDVCTQIPGVWTCP